MRYLYFIFLLGCAFSIHKHGENNIEDFMLDSINEDLVDKKYHKALKKINAYEENYPSGKYICQILAKRSSVYFYLADLENYEKSLKAKKFCIIDDQKTQKELGGVEASDLKKSINDAKKKIETCFFNKASKNYFSHIEFLVNDKANLQDLTFRPINFEDLDISKCVSEQMAISSFPKAKNSQSYRVIIPLIVQK